MNFKQALNYLLQHARYSCSQTGVSETTLDDASNIVENFVKYLPNDFTDDATPNMQKLNTPSDFCDDKEKMLDFRELSKDEFLSSYSYITEEEYNFTRMREKDGNCY